MGKYQQNVVGGIRRLYQALIHAFSGTSKPANEFILDKDESEMITGKVLSRCVQDDNSIILFVNRCYDHPLGRYSTVRIDHRALLWLAHYKKRRIT